MNLPGLFETSHKDICFDRGSDKGGYERALEIIATLGPKSWLARA